MAYVYQVVDEDDFGNPIYGLVDDGVVDVDSQGDLFDLSGVTTVDQGRGVLQGIYDALGKTAKDAAAKLIFNDGDPAKGLNFAGLATGAAGLYSLFGNTGSSTPQAGGYNVPVPTKTAARAQIPYPADPNRRPGEAGRSYFTDVQYNDPAEAAAAQTAANTQAQGIASAYVPKTATVNPYASGNKAFPTKYNPGAGIADLYKNIRSYAANVNPAFVSNLGTAQNPFTQKDVEAKIRTDMANTGVNDTDLFNATGKTFAELVGQGFNTGTANNASGVASLLPIPSPNAAPVKAAEGGLMSFAKGGANYLRGRTDGMADKLNTSIDNRQAAKLSHGEFVIPADVVSHLGNGNSDAGADKLYQMMARIRKARTGNPKQGKRINPDKFMPGGLASLNMGGAIGFVEGGDTTTTAAKLPTPGTSTSSSLSSWAGPYVTSTLGEGAALAARPYETYTGPLTAGASDLQNQAFAGAQTVANTGYDPTRFTSGTFGATQAQQYMNPYLSAVLDPQMKELQRQADITRVENAGRMTQRGAYGGSRQAIGEAEDRKNLLSTQATTLGQGYASAYDKAMGQFNTQADRDMTAQRAGEESRQFGANFGLKSLGELERMGGTQRQIAAEGTAADKAQFEEQRDYPAAMVKFKRDLMTGLPMSTQTSNALPMSGIGELAASVGGLSDLYQLLAKFGQPTTKTP